MYPYTNSCRVMFGDWEGKGSWVRGPQGQRTCLGWQFSGPVFPLRPPWDSNPGAIAQEIKDGPRAHSRPGCRGLCATTNPMPAVVTVGAWSSSVIVHCCLHWRPKMHSFRSAKTVMLLQLSHMQSGAQQPCPQSRARD